MNGGNLKSQINDKNKLVRDLRTNQNFFKEICEGKLKEFLEKIRFDIKGKIFNKVVKANLHFIYKHYENLQKISPRDAAKILQNNLEK